ncbi:MAG: twin-arginine translocation signal domain-containing protein [Pirellulales bacterium]|nr:twin-arginine translocation signal domain-containing protein [Pirellulales bacterium]
MNRRDFLYDCGRLAAGASLVAGPWCRAVGAAESDRAEGERPAPAAGPLRVHPDNRRYFTDGTGKAVYLTGSHTWSNLVDMGPTDPPEPFDFAACLEWTRRLGHNFIRGWTWETFNWDVRENRNTDQNTVFTVAPHPWARTGPGQALDGRPKFDLTQFDPDYFQRLRQRTMAAGRQGIYLSLMLFEGWGMQFAPGAWRAHPMHPENNVNGINGDADGDGNGLEIHALAVPAVTKVQEAYVRKVLDTLNDLDNVLYEISNENHPPSTEWQYHMIRHIQQYERGKAKQHPVGMTFQYRGGSNQTLFDSPADWISPNHEGGYRDNPPAADGRKVILTDTDHLWGIGGNAAWVWKSFLRGLNPLFMDPYDGVVLGKRFDPQWQPIREALGHTRRLADRLKLASLQPRDALASSGYCLANAARRGAEYLVYLPQGGEVTVDLSATAGELSVEWIRPANGAPSRGSPVAGGHPRRLTAPFPGDAVLLLRGQ